MSVIDKRISARRKAKDPEKNRATILAAAIIEFAERGLHGGRMDAIAKASSCDKQLLYYYFESKEGLYIAALEHAYAQIRNAQLATCIDLERPLESLIDLVLNSYNFVSNNQNYIKLITNENREKGEYVKKSSLVRGINRPLIDKIELILSSGAQRGVFRRDVDALQFHRVTSALINHSINNAYTFGYIFDADMLSAEARDRYRSTIADVISHFVRADRN